MDPEVAKMVASPAALAVATPVAGSIVATSVELLDHPTVTLTGCPAASAPAAVNCCVPPALIVAVGGVTVIEASGPVTSSTSLHAPSVFAAGACQVPDPSRCSDIPSASVPASLTPISTDVMPTAAPSVATNVPSYERNSMTVLLASTSAMPSGLPF